MSRLRYDYNLLKEICDEAGITLLVDYKDKYVTRDTRIIASIAYIAHHKHQRYQICRIAPALA